MSLMDELARTSDPEPSSDAAALDHATVSARVLSTLVHFGAMTANEIRDRLGDPQPDRNSVSRRLTSLVRQGLVLDTGMKRPGGKGVRVRVFAATREGREVAARG